MTAQEIYKRAEARANDTGGVAGTIMYWQSVMLDVITECSLANGVTKEQMARIHLAATKWYQDNPTPNEKDTPR